jgi:hypothetical protein
MEQPNYAILFAATTIVDWKAMWHCLCLCVFQIKYDARIRKWNC